MKKPHIVILQKKDNLASLSPLLKRMGFTRELFSGLKALRFAIQKSAPDLLLVDIELTDKQEDGQSLSEEITEVCPLLLVAKEEDEFLLFDRQHKRVSHIVDLHDYFCQNLNSYSRNNLRVAVNLPSLLTDGNSPQHAQITCLGTGGVFVKTGYPTPEQGQLLEITIPLLGHCTELDVCGRVAHSVSPCLENNYIQGVGVSFEQPDQSSVTVINNYLSSLIKNPLINCVIGEAGHSSLVTVAKSPRSVGIAPKLR